jgi:hypothetical protein
VGTNKAALFLNLVRISVDFILLPLTRFKMGQLEDSLAQAVKDGKVPHAVVFATNKDGISFQCFGGPEVVESSDM